jgi:hypothetical protein
MWMKVIAGADSFNYDQLCLGAQAHAPHVLTEMREQPRSHRHGHEKDHHDHEQWEQPGPNAGVCWRLDAFFRNVSVLVGSQIGCSGGEAPILTPERCSRSRNQQAAPV